MRFARGWSGALGGEGAALLQGGPVECDRGGDADHAALAAADGPPGAEGLADGVISGGVVA
ncbi:hypothetical protein ACTIVE_0707 [Actinomadura verrucosospora]|uniref:Uncharacterized protein n=1 Tax=Actinomadura verrucosospora TaxID=46165 RepID=A0A7D3VTQ1_ACTVE|nr:hypothetical protein ACTIVE_0707 [Actinomadura verrucosospora]